MKQRRFLSAFAILALLSAVIPAIPLLGEEAGSRHFSGGSYLCTIKAGENYASTAVITLHTDRTMSVTDSAQGGPDNYFSSQLGSWKPDGHRNIAAKAISFRFPPSAPAIARTDFDIALTQGHSHIEGTIQLMLFSYEDPNPLEGEGTLIGTFNFRGELIKLR